MRISLRSRGLAPVPCGEDICSGALTGALAGAEAPQFPPNEAGGAGASALWVGGTKGTAGAPVSKTDVPSWAGTLFAPTPGGALSDAAALRYFSSSRRTGDRGSSGLSAGAIPQLPKRLLSYPGRPGADGGAMPEEE